MNHNGNPIEARLWAAADELRANSKLKSSEYSVPVLGLVFLRYADHKFQALARELEGAGGGRRRIGPADYQARGVLYLPEAARFSTLIKIPEGANIGAAINEAMRAIEAENPDLKDVLPKTYNRFENALLKELLKTLNSVPMDIEGDAFGKIYEYFLGNFARAEGQKGGEFFTPTAIVQLIVGIIEPFHGRIYDPACGSGGMFVQSARFVEEHKKNPSAELSVYGQEKVAETVRLGKMNLAVHGLSGDIRQGNAYYEDLHNSVGRFDFVMANPPFNVDRVDKDRLKADPRFPFGLPRNDNANYLWIQLFYSALSDTGRAGFVMANSASDPASPPPSPPWRCRSAPTLLHVTCPAPLVPGQRQRDDATAPSSTPATSIARSTAPTGTGPPPRSSFSPTSPGSSGARSPRTCTTAPSCSPSTSPAAATRTWPVGKVATIADIEAQGWSRTRPTGCRRAETTSTSRTAGRANEELETRTARRGSWRGGLRRMWQCCGGE